MLERGVKLRRSVISGVSRRTFAARGGSVRTGASSDFDFEKNVSALLRPLNPGKMTGSTERLCQQCAKRRGNNKWILATKFMTD